MEKDKLKGVIIGVAAIAALGAGGAPSPGRGCWRRQRLRQGDHRVGSRPGQRSGAQGHRGRQGHADRGERRGELLRGGGHARGRQPGRRAARPRFPPRGPKRSITRASSEARGGDRSRLRPGPRAGRGDASPSAPTSTTRTCRWHRGAGGSTTRRPQTGEPARRGEGHEPDQADRERRDGPGGARHRHREGPGRRGHVRLVRAGQARQRLVPRRGHQGVRERQGAIDGGLVGGRRRRRRGRDRHARAPAARAAVPPGVLQGPGRRRAKVLSVAEQAEVPFGHFTQWC